MSDEHLCLTELLDQDLTAYEYFQTLSSDVQIALRDKEIATFDELQSAVNDIQKQQPQA